MKEKYIRPVSQAFEFETPCMLAPSQGNPQIDVDSSTEAGASESFTNKGGWNSGLWNETEE